MPAPSPLGNDIVDPGTASNRASAANPRYIKRVLAPQEFAALTLATRQNAAFWAYWAAKEAAYKALIKTDPKLVFSHRRFVVATSRPSPFNVDCGTARGTVRYLGQHPGQTLSVTWNWTKDWIHCVTSSTSNPGRIKVSTLSRLRDHAAFIDMKKTSSLSDQSIAARLLTVSLLKEYGISDTQIVRPRTGRRPGPPQVMRDGILLPGLDVSLSHDGRYAAAAVRAATESQTAQPDSPN